MADSKLYKTAVAEGYGIAQLVMAKFPNNPELSVIQPVTNGPFKGFFPAGQICRIFDKEFKHWNNQFKAGSTRGRKQQRFMTCLLARLTKVEGKPVLKSDLIVTIQSSAVGVPRSYIHPRLMTHFLMWCCPEFADEVVNVFNSYVSGTLDIQAQTELIRQAHVAELATVRNDLLGWKEIADRQQRELLERDQQLRVALDSNAKLTQDAIVRCRESDQYIETLKINNTAIYEQLLKEKTEKDAQLLREREMREESDMKCTELERSLDRDITRPRNCLRDVEDAMRANRHSQPLFHSYAAFVPRAMGIALSQKAFAVMAFEVFRRVNFIHGNRDKEWENLMNDLRNPHRIDIAKDRIRGWYDYALTDCQRNKVCWAVRRVLYASLLLLFEKDMTLDLEESITALDRGGLWNPVTLQTMISTLMKLGEEVEYCTELQVGKLTDMARVFNVICEDMDINMHLVLPEDLDDE